MITVETSCELCHWLYGKIRDHQNFAENPWDSQEGELATQISKFISVERLNNTRKDTLFISASVSTVSCFSLRTWSGTSCGRRPALPVNKQFFPFQNSLKSKRGKSKIKDNNCVINTIQPEYKKSAVPNSVIIYSSNDHRISIPYMHSIRKTPRQLSEVRVLQEKFQGT